MDVAERGQVSRSAAEVYEAFFIPALFQQWTHAVADAARLRPGQRVLDVACGTGVLARTAAERVKPGGSVVGLDINDGMLDVAARQASDIEWRAGRAEELPFEDGSFDAVVSQFGLMFFEDRHAALREMIRVLRSGGRLAVAVWGPLSMTPGYAAMVDLLDRLFGEQVANGLRAPFNLGDVQALRSLFSEAGISDAQISTQVGTARFPSIDAWVYTDVKGWVFDGMLNDGHYERLLNEAKRVLSPFVTPEGSVAFNSPAHIVSAVRD